MSDDDIPTCPECGCKWPVFGRVRDGFWCANCKYESPAPSATENERIEGLSAQSKTGSEHWYEERQQEQDRVYCPETGRVWRLDASGHVECPDCSSFIVSYHAERVSRPSTNTPQETESL